MGIVDYCINKIGEGSAWILKKSAQGWSYILIAGGKKVLTALFNMAKGASNYPDIFILAGTMGMVMVIMGKKNLGTKIASGSVIAYAILKAVR